MTESRRVDGPQWTRNSIEKTRERFPGKDIESLYYIAKLVPRKGKIRKAIKEICAPREKIWMANGYIGRYYKITPDRIVFVLAAPETVLTVFQL
jgi:hypothetical protein